MVKLKFLHISDTHFLVEYGNSLDRWGVNYNPAKIFENFLKEYDFSDIDFVVHTGDLVHDGGEVDYSAIRFVMEKYIPKEVPFFCCLGNHDKKQEFYKGYLNNDDAGLYSYQISFNGYRLIFLDTASETEHGGIIDDKQANWLMDILKEPSEKGSLIFQHHPLEISWVENLEVTKVPDNYIDCLNDSDVIGIFTGHLHQNRHVQLGHIPQHTAGAFVFGMSRIDGKVWNTNRLGYSEVEVSNKAVDVYAEIVYPKLEKFNTEIL